MRTLCGKMVFNLYSMGFDDGASGKDSKTKEELLILGKADKLPKFYQDKLNEAVCRAYVWGWEDFKFSNGKKSESEINEAIYKPVQKIK